MDARIKPTRRRKAAGPVGGQVQSLVRGLTLLERLAQSRGGVSLTDLAQRVGLAPSTAHRLLNTLEGMGFVQQRGELGLWYVGANAYTVGCAFLQERDIVAQSHPHLRALMSASGETANLGVMVEGRIVIVDQVQSHQMMRMLAPLGSRAPAHASGAGKAILSAMAPEAVAQVLLAHGLERYCPNTIQTPAELAAELSRTRERGYAIDDEEHAVGLFCLAAPIFDEHGEPVAAISISGPKPRIPASRVGALGELVSGAAREITAAIGGRAPAPRAPEAPPRAGARRGKRA
jgi:IclR family transcriptional regulator, acetate operon repressor